MVTEIDLPPVAVTPVDEVRPVARTTAPELLPASSDAPPPNSTAVELPPADETVGGQPQRTGSRPKASTPRRLKGPSEPTGPDIGSVVLDPAARSNPTLMWIGASVAVALFLGGAFAVVHYFVTREPSPVAPIVEEIPLPTAVVAAPPTPTAVEPLPAPVEAAVSEAYPEPEGPVPPPGGKQKPPRVRKLGGKRVVIEYDLKPASTAPMPGSPAVVGANMAEVKRARDAYHRGNLKLSLKDFKGAAEEFREALTLYPGYVAGYRGLGQAYAAAGEKDHSLKAYRLYLKTVPNAADAAQIKKWVEFLQKK